jgi:protein ImuB
MALWLRRLSTDRLAREARAAPSADGLATYARAGSAFLIDAVDARAAALGVRAGMALADARALRPALTVIAADPSADEAARLRAAAFCERYTPAIAPIGRDGVLMEIAASAHLFGGEAALRAEITDRFTQAGFTTRVALADTAHAAWALARYARDPVAAPGETGEALAPLPIAALGLADDVADLLQRLGLYTIGALIARPRAPFAARAGQAAQTRLDEALGRAEPALAYQRTPPPLFALRRFLEPLAQAEALINVCAEMAEELAGALELRGMGARRLRLNLFGVSGRVRRIEAGFSRPERAVRALTRVFAEKLQAETESSDLEFGVEALRLDVVALARWEAGADLGDARLVDALAARLGAASVRRIFCADAHLPEAAGASASACEPGALKPQAQSIEAPPRPLTLLARPESIEAVAPVPDGAPLRFRWRRVLRDVARAEGPERLSGDWLAGARARDYFRVEDYDGHRYWLFREGLYGRDTDAPRWFMHGLFP